MRPIQLWPDAGPIPGLPGFFEATNPILISRARDPASLVLDGERDGLGDAVEGRGAGDEEVAGRRARRASTDPGADLP